MSENANFMSSIVNDIEELCNYNISNKEKKSGRAEGDNMNIHVFSQRKTKGKATRPASAGGGYQCRMDTQAVVKNNTLMNGITSSRGQAMGFIQEDKMGNSPSPRN